MINPLITAIFTRDSCCRGLQCWGKTAHKLASHNIFNVFDLTFANEHRLAHTLSIYIAHAIRELKGQSYISLDDPETPSQCTLSSRSFAQALSNITPIRHPISFHINCTQ